MAIIIILFATYILIKCNAGAWLLERFKLEEYQQQDDPQSTPPPHEINERYELEQQARYIIAQQGHDPESAQYMSNALLQALINDYIKACK